MNVNPYSKTRINLSKEAEKLTKILWWLTINHHHRHQTPKFISNIGRENSNVFTQANSRKHCPLGIATGKENEHNETIAGWNKTAFCKSTMGNAKDESERLTEEPTDIN